MYCTFLRFPIVCCLRVVQPYPWIGLTPLLTGILGFSCGGGRSVVAVKDYAFLVLGSVLLVLPRDSFQFDGIIFWAIGLFLPSLLCFFRVLKCLELCWSSEYARHHRIVFSLCLDRHSPIPSMFAQNDT